jgi:hypothetical protein
MVASAVKANGALAIPLVGADGCVGVFAIEVRHGREADPATRAVAAMFAAQLSTILPVWPAASGEDTNILDSDSIAASGQA